MLAASDIEEVRIKLIECSENDDGVIMYLDTKKPF